MANAVYPEYKEFLLSAAANVSLNVNDATDGPFCSLYDVGAGGAYDGTDDFYDDVVAGNVGTTQRIVNPTVANGTFDGDNLTYTAVSGATVEALVIYRHNSGANTTWKLVAYLDTGVTGLPVTPNGGDITVTWNASGIFTISDQRFKENIEQVGELGPVGIYSYNYLDSDECHLGLMAQEVERVFPEAVLDTGTFKAVDYQKAIDKFSL